MGRYINWDNVVARYPKVADVGGADEVDGTYIQYAESWVEGQLSGYFTAPFSSNNVTAKDLMIDATYAKVLAFRDETKAKAITDRLAAMVKELREGVQAMVTTSGDPMYSEGAGAAWSNTKDYHSSFGMHEIEDQVIDVDLIEDEYDERS